MSASQDEEILADPPVFQVDQRQDQCCTKQERFRKRERGKHHFPKILGSEAFVIYIYIYILHFTFKKHVERQISCRIYEHMHIRTSI
jgi:hypothetical protein